MQIITTGNYYDFVNIYTGEVEEGRLLGRAKDDSFIYDDETDWEPVCKSHKVIINNKIFTVDRVKVLGSPINDKGKLSITKYL